MLYVYNKKELMHQRVNLFKIAAATIGFVSLTGFITYQYGLRHGFEKLSDVERAVVIRKSDEFTEEKFASMLKELKIKFPHIVMAQSLVETGHWKSAIFLENYNLFGMKEARRRITTAGGTSRNHAYYDHWRESVYDYAFYQSRYLHNVSSEAAYFQYLQASYAEDPNYVSKVKQTIERYELRKHFK